MLSEGAGASSKVAGGGGGRGRPRAGLGIPPGGSVFTALCGRAPIRAPGIRASKGVSLW